MRQLGSYALWIGFSNLLFALVLAISTNFEVFGSAINFFKSVNYSVAVVKSDLLTVSRLQRVDNEMLASLATSHPKSGLNITRVEMTGVSVQDYDVLASDNVNPSNDVTSGPETPNSDTYALDQENKDIGPSGDVESGAASPVARQKVAPILLKDKMTGQLQIGNFKSLAMAGSVGECLNVGQSMLGDVGSSTKRLDVLVSSKQITIAKICASNGVVVISCRSQQITVSPRHFQMDDKCKSIG